MQNLYRRGGMWWARLSVPPKLRNAAGRSEFTKSTRTHDLTIAKMVAAAYLVVWRGQLLTLKSSAMPDIDVLKIVQSAHEFTGDGYLTLTEAEAKSGIPAKRLLEAAGAGRVPLYGRLSNVPGYRVSLGALEPIDPALGLAAGVVIPPPNEMPPSAEHHVVSDYLRVTDSQEVARAILAEELIELEILSYDLPQGGGWIFVPNEAPTVQVSLLSVATTAVSSIRAALADSLDAGHIERLQRTAMRSQGDVETNDDWSRLPYSEAVERYAVDPSGLLANSGNRDELKQRKKKLLLLSEFMGDLELGAIDSDTLRAFRDGPLKTLPANSNHLPSGIRKASMRETVAALEAEGLEWPTMTRAQQHDRMLLLSQLFTWLTEKKHVKTNPSASLRGETGLTKAQLKDLRRNAGSGSFALQGAGAEGEKGRAPFTDSELALIFNQPRYQTAANALLHGNARCYPFEYWLPLLGLFAGCRIKEVAQLYLSDVKQIEGLWFLDINERTTDKTVKNEAAKRCIAVHPLLIELGLLRYCDALRDAGYKRVFPEISYVNSDARYAKEPIRKMSQMLNELGMPRDGSKVYHCFRHLFNDALSQLPDSRLLIDDKNRRIVARYITTGHQIPKDTNMKVYTHPTPVELHRMVSLLNYQALPAIKPFDVAAALELIRAALNKKHGDRKGREDLGPNMEFNAPAL